MYDCIQHASEWSLSLVEHGFVLCVFSMMLFSVSSPIVAEAKLCVSVFIDMERSAQLQSYYSQCHKVTTSYRI